MKHSLFLTLVLTVLFLGSYVYAGNVTIGNNQTGGGTAEDTVTIGGYVRDSTGNSIVPDGFVVLVVNPVGDSVYCDELTTADLEINVLRAFGPSGRFYYATFTKAISDIDGVGEGRVGTYVVFFTVLYKTAVGSFLNGYDDTWIGSIKVVAPETKVYYYNIANPAVVDSVQTRVGSTVVRVDRYYTTDFQKPDSLVTGVK